MEEQIEEKQLTLKSLDKKTSEKFAEIDKKMSELIKNIEIIKKVVRGK